MNRTSKRSLLSPGRRAFLVVGGVLGAGYFLFKEGANEVSSRHSAAEGKSAKANPDSITVDSTEIKIGAAER